MFLLSSERHFTTLKLAVFLASFFVFFSTASSWAADSITATKDTTVSPATTGGDTTFTIATDQIIFWNVTYTPSSPTDGNDFYLHTPGGLLNEIPLSTNLSTFDSGEIFLTANTYEISITYFGMGDGSYTIEFNRTASIGLSPTSHNFGDVLEGEVSPTETFTISSTGDLPVTITSVSSSDPTHFPIISSPAGSDVPPSRTFDVRCNAGVILGPKGANITVSGTNASITVSPVTASVMCNVEPKEPDIACFGNTSLGTADWTIPETITGNRTFSNNGNEDLILTSITLVNDSSLAPFSLSGTPSLSPVPDGSSRSVAIQFAAPMAGGEATYTGHIIITSNDPDEPVKQCFFQAVAHHPEPRMIIDSLTLDYHEVELGFSFTKAIVVRNVGDAPLNLIVQETNPADLDLPQWTVREAGMRTIAPGGEEFYKETYTPLAVGNHGFQMTVSGNDPTNLQQIVTLVAEAIPPVPIDSVLVLDRSASMGNPTGAMGSKLNALKQAASLFIDVLALRSSPLPATEADKLGLVRYNHQNDEYLSLDPIQGTHVTDAINQINNLTHDGNTGIGGAMERAAGMLVTTPADRKHIMVVLSDGIETNSPWINDVVPVIAAADSNLKMYSIGLGNDSAIDAGKLQSITNVLNGFHQVEGDLNGLRVFDLETFYFKIFANAADMQLPLDPTVQFNLNTLSPIPVGQVYVSSSDKSATFLILDVPALRTLYDLEFISPTGLIVTSGSTIGGVGVQEMSRHTYRLIRIVFPSLLHASEYVGNWTLRLTPKGTINEKEVIKMLREYGWSTGNWGGGIDPPGGIVPIGFVAAVASDYRMDVATTSSTTLPGAEVTLTAEFTDRHWPAPNATAKATIDTPTGANYGPITLYDDGTHGDVEAGDAIFTTKFTQTSASGSYKVFFQGQGYNDYGQLVPREATRYVTLMNPLPDPRDDDCLPCRIKNWLWAIVIGLLLLTLLCCYYRKRG